MEDNKKGLGIMYAIKKRNSAKKMSSGGMVPSAQEHEDESNYRDMSDAIMQKMCGGGDVKKMSEGGEVVDDAEDYSVPESEHEGLLESEGDDDEGEDASAKENYMGSSMLDSIMRHIRKKQDSED